ncbi:hypothetical protein ACQ0QQ_15380 [Lysinibacillus sphaericus]
MGRFPVGKLTILLFLIEGTMWLGSGLISSNNICILLFGISWIPIGATNVIFGAAIQSMVPTRILGRIFSVTASMGAAAMPLGCLLGGVMASQFGPEAVYISSSGGILFIALVWTLNKTLRFLPETSRLTPGEMGLPEEEPAVSGEVISC